MIQIYADGAYNPVLNQGGWGVVIVNSGEKRVFSGAVKRTTSNRMEINAAIEGILHTPSGSEVVVYTDSQYLFGCVAKGWQRRANRDLWAQLDEAVRPRQVGWQWIDQRAGNPFHQEAHTLATRLATESKELAEVSSVPPQKRQPPPQMVPSEAVSGPTLRLVDANLNRLSEGLRLLEDMARLLLNDAVLTQQLKTMRHELIRGDRAFHQQLLQSRDSTGDVGTDIEVNGEEKERELPLVLVANARRVQESLRVLEELAKVPGAIKLDPEKFKQARFNLYTVERELMGKLLRQDKLKRISGLYVILDTQALEGRDHLEVANQVIRGGAKIIQLRDKVQSKAALLPIARKLQTLCTEHNVLFLMNDYLDIALAVGADGLHLGQEDLPLAVARQLLPLDKILGGSTTSVDQARKAQSAGADYVAVGSIYPTSSKEKTKLVGLAALRQIRQAVSLPLVAIGGITRDNVSEVLTAGADAVAVISAISGVESPQEASRQIANIFEVQQ